MGELRLTQQGFSHHQGAKVTSYQLLPSDSIEPTSHGMTIYNADGLTLYHITGFHDPKHIKIAQAVLQGKPIKTQGKAIKLRSTQSENHTLSHTVVRLSYQIIIIFLPILVKILRDD